MRISDWSSDVCSSDLGGRMGRPTAKRVMCAVSMGVLSGLPARGMAQGIPDAPRAGVAQEVDERKITVATRPKPELDPIGVRRSEERRVGKECVSQYSCRWSQ